MIDILKPTPEQIAGFERAAEEWPYAFEAQSIGYLNNQEDYEVFVVLQVFRGQGLPDTIYLYDERYNPDNGFGCGGPVAEDWAKSGFFFVKCFSVKPIRTLKGTLGCV